MEGEGGLPYADEGADLERRDVHENVVAIEHAPFVTPWRGAQVILAVIDFIAAIPVFVSDGCALPPFLVLDVSVVVVMVPILGVVVMVPVLGKGDTSHKTCGEDRER